MEEKTKEQLKAKGHRALILNIIFFIVLFAGIFLVTITGLTVTAIIISLVFVASLLYIHYT